jgi:23S rRNA (cytidine1920-2'-O)/16S rRNA (cytidine1409-2'-O)-methyltransferase
MAQIPKERLDLLLLQRDLAASRQQAQALILAGRVSVGGQPVDKPGTRVSRDVEVTVEEALPYVSRGGFKLAAALDAFELDVGGWIVADVGASTGGFVDCLLQRGAARVYAIDVGYGQLAWSLRQDSRVVVMDRTNARYLESLPEPVNLVTVDASFISLRLLLPVIEGWLRPAEPKYAPQPDPKGFRKPLGSGWGGQIIALVKPQFEAGREQVGKGGVVRDPAVHRQVLEGLIDWAALRAWGLQGLIRSPVTGPAGNVEFLAHWVPGSAAGVDPSLAIAACVER